MKMKTLILALFIGLLNLTQAHAQNPSALLEMNAGEFKEFLKTNKGLVILLPTATWCVNCKKLEPEYEKAAIDMKGAVTMVKMDYDRSPDFIRSLGIQSLPQTEVYFNGVRYWEYRGGMPATRLEFETSQAIDAIKDGSFSIKRYTLLNAIQ